MENESPFQTRVLCLTDTPSLYEPLGDEYDVELVFLDSVPALIESMASAPLHGVIVEVRKLLRSSQHEKEVLHEYLEPFPVMRVNVVRMGEGWELRPLGSFEDFLKRTCAEFNARTVRAGVRIRLHLPLLLARADDKDFCRSIKTYTVDISQGGVFVFSSEDWEGEQWVWVKCPFLEDDTPFLGHIRWTRSWGGLFEPSGLGLMFADIREGQHAELCNRFLLRKSFEMPNVEELEELRDALEKFLLEHGERAEGEGKGEVC